MISRQAGADPFPGMVIYNQCEFEETQDFCWHVKEDNLPKQGVYELAKLLNKYQLLDIDMITLSRQELLDKYNIEFSKDLNIDEFNPIVDELESIEVAMVDDIEEGDSYFIHE